MNKVHTLRDLRESIHALKITVDIFAYCQHLDNMSDAAIMELNLPTGIPFVYELDADMKPVVSMQFLGDEETVKKAIESVANQGKAK